MRTPVVYDYAVIRVVPRVEREEFINAGVLISCQATRTLAAAMALDPARLRALDPHVDVETVARHLDAIVRICRGDADGGAEAGAQKGGFNEAGDAAEECGDGHGAGGAEDVTVAVFAGYAGGFKFLGASYSAVGFFTHGCFLVRCLGG